MKKHFSLFGLFLLIFIFIFRDLLLHITTNLIDWRDYPLVIWIMHQDMTKIINLDFNNVFNSNIYYPNKYTLLFSDLLLPQALFSLIPFLLTKNLIFSFNVAFVLTFILNYVSTYLFWGVLFKNKITSFIGSLLIIFTVFFNLEISHYQMLNFWPFFFCLYFLIRDKKINYKNNLIAGIFLAIQFLASVYLSFFLVTALAIYYLIYSKHKLTSFKLHFLGFLLILITFLVLDGFFIKGYLDMKNTYHFQRSFNEYISYSAHLSDYLFTNNIHSLMHQSSIMSVWNKANKHFLGAPASFPGFLIFSTFVLALFNVFNIKQKKYLGIEISQQNSFFLVVILVGFIFSLGPRLNFNGYYAELPLPYYPFIKYIPTFESIRVLSRWGFLFYFGLVYFSLISVDKFLKKSLFALPIILFVFFIEYVPVNLQTEAHNYLTSQDSVLSKLCSPQKQVLLEVPVTHLDSGSSIVEGLTYITSRELASTYHNCYLINGYTGYDLPANFQLASDVDHAITNQNTSEFIILMKQNHVDLVEFNNEAFIKENKIPGLIFLDNIATESAVQRISKNLFRIKYNN
jgi:hypothetical protein